VVDFSIVFRVSTSSFSQCFGTAECKGM